MDELHGKWDADCGDYFDGEEMMKLTKEQIDALELVAHQGIIIYQKVISESGSVEMVKDIVREYFIALVHGRNNPSMLYEPKKD